MNKPQMTMAEKKASKYNWTDWQNAKSHNTTLIGTCLKDGNTSYISIITGNVDFWKSEDISDYILKKK